MWLGALTTPSTQALWTPGLHPGRQRSSFVLRRLSQCSGPSPARSLATAGRDMAVGTVGGRHDVRAWVGLRGWTGARPSDLEGGTSCHGAPSLLFPALQWSGTAALAFLLRPANRVSAPGVPVMTVSQTWPRAGHGAQQSVWGPWALWIRPCPGPLAEGPGNSLERSVSPAGCWAPLQLRPAGVGPHVRGQGGALPTQGVQRQAREAQPSPAALLYLPPQRLGAWGRGGRGARSPRAQQRSKAGPVAAVAALYLDAVTHA